MVDDTSLKIESRSLEKSMYSICDEEIGMGAGNGFFGRYPFADILFESLPLGVVFQDLEGKITGTNPAAEKILGLSFDQMRGVTSIDPRWQAVRGDGSAFPGEEHPAMVSLRTKQPVRDVQMGVFNPKAERMTWINVSAFPVKAEINQPVQGVYALFEDITERKLAQQNEAESELLFKSLFSSMSEGVAIHELIRDASGRAINYRIVDVNQAFEAQTGLSRDSVIGKLATEAYGVQAPFLATYTSVAMTQQPTAFEADFPPLGKQFRINVFSPQLYYFVTIFEDITERKHMEAAQEASQAELAEAQRIAHMGSWHWDINTDENVVSDELLRIFGRETIPPFAQQGGVLYPPEVWRKLNDAVREAVDTGIGYNLDLSALRGDGTQIWINTRCHPAYDATGKLVGLRGTIQDITSRMQTEEALRESQKLFNLFMDKLPAAAFMKDQDSTTVYLNRYMEDLVGGRSWIGKTPDDLFPQEVAEKMIADDQHALATGYLVTEEHVQGADGQLRLYETHKFSISRQGQTPLIGGIALDITERKTAADKIEHLAFYDSLTDLPNRTLILDRLRQALIASNRTAEYGALMILDLDNFKVTNDTMGHDVGDQLLIEVAKRIVSSIRPEDTVSRLGGDEYLVMIECLGSDETVAASRIEMIAEKIRIALNKQYILSHGGQIQHSTPSIGVTMFRGDKVTIDTLFKQADMALYQAKGAGRNTIRFFNPAMQAAIESQSRMEAALRKGLQNGEFQLYYQPRVDQAKQTNGAEALLRWMPADQKPVSPASFIPLAESSGLIIPLGVWVMQTACAQLKAWSKNPATRDLQISINVSARQFHEEYFVGHVFDSLKQSGANPKLLKLELTESVVLENVEDVILKMQQIKALGVTFSLDDFGTGFSSLSYLKRLPLDEVKIDQSFVRDITSDPNDAAIVRAILAISSSLGIRVIAEGVENEAQLQFLIENGCRYFQGYLFGKPKPIAEWNDGS